MSDLSCETPPFVAEYLLPWEVDTDRETGVLAFVNERANLKILVLCPATALMLDQKTEGQWAAKLIDGSPFSTLRPYFIASGETQIDLLDALEDLLCVSVEQDNAFLAALAKLQSAGLEIESVAGVASEYVLSGMDTKDRVRGYLRVGAGRYGKPKANPNNLDADRLQSVLISLGLSESETRTETALLKIALAG